MAFETRTFLTENQAQFINLSDKIWACPELNFQEFEATRLTKDVLLENGFTVQEHVAGLPTALLGQFGSGDTVIAFLGEYDALPSLSQQGGISTFEPIEQNGNGHGCGHNLLGSGALAAACALKAYVERTNAPVTIRFYACPAEEAGSGKAHMVKAGVFNDVDLAISWHPWYFNGVMNMRSLANYAIKFKFYGKSSHAAASPHLGRSALDAVELMNVGVNYLREHVEQEVRMHYAVTNTGGTAPNVVQSYAEATYLIRAPRKKQVQNVVKRVQNIAQGAALMTETKVEIEFEGAASDLIPNTTLAEVMQQQLVKMEPIAFTAEEQQFAQAIFDTFDEDVKDSVYQQMPKEALDMLGESRLSPEAMPLIPEQMLYGSTDVGDVSWMTPTVQLMTATWVLGTPPHTWQAVAVGNTSMAHKGMLYAAEAMANTAIAAIEEPNIIVKAKKELQERLNGEQYVSLIPEYDANN